MKVSYGVGWNDSGTHTAPLTHCKLSLHTWGSGIKEVWRLHYSVVINFRCKTTEPCFDVYPQRDPSLTRAPAESEIDKGLESLQYNLPERWKQHRCDDYVYIVYVEMNQQVGHGEGRGVGFITTNRRVLSEGKDPRAVCIIIVYI